MMMAGVSTPAPGHRGAHVAALQILRTLGWRDLSAAQCEALRGGTREVLLKPRLIEFLQTRRFDYKGEPHPLSHGSIDQILREFSALSMGDGLLAANERLYAKLLFGITVSEFMPDGKKHPVTVSVIDWADVGANRFDVVEDMQVLVTHGPHHRAPSLTCFVNGIPLALIEARQPPRVRGGSDAMVREGILRHLDNQRDEEIPNLYAYAQLLLSISGTDGCYGTTRTPPALWARWTREEEFDDAQIQALKAAPPNAQDRLLVSLLTPARLLSFVRGFVLFDRKAGKIVARHQQFFGVRALLQRLASRRADGGREGGVLWHTTGSGKSLTMVFLSKALLLDEALKECRVIVVTDRKDLEAQLSRNFTASGVFGSSVGAQKEGERSKALTGRDLARRIGQGTGRITFALVQKFNSASRLPECRNDSADIIVLVDEGHRSHGGETHQRMRKVLPRAACVAFTGTPLLKAEKTQNVFGPVVHAYTMHHAVEDRTVAPLLYEERVPALVIDAPAVDRWLEGMAASLPPARRGALKRQFSHAHAIHGAAGRIELIAWDIALHFSENFKKIAPGLKGQLATASKRDAIRYKKALDGTGLVSSVVIMSAPDSVEGDARAGEEDEAEVLRWWRRNVPASAEGMAQYEREALRAFSSAGGPDLLIVVDRLLTGFDEPRNAVLYIDKPLKGHNLIQAVARVNRLHEAKHHGLLVDYRGILKELDTALRAYGELEARTQGGFDAADLDGLYAQVGTEYKRLPSLHEAVWFFFDSLDGRDDPEPLRQALAPRFVGDGQGGQYDERQRLRDDFFAALTAFGLCLRTALSSRGFFEDEDFSEAALARYKKDFRLLSGVRQSLEHGAVEPSDGMALDEHIRKLVDQHVQGTAVHDARDRFAVRLLGQPEPATHWPEEKTRSEADLIKTRLRKSVEQDLADDPYARKVFSELLQGAIAKAEAMFDHPGKQYALLSAFAQQVEARATPGVPAVLKDDPQARAYYGAILLALGEDAAALDAARQKVHAGHALAIGDAVRQAAAEHSVNPQGMEAAIRRTLLRQFHAVFGLAKTNEVIEQVLHITRVGLSRRQ